MSKRTWPVLFAALVIVTQAVAAPQGNPEKGKRDAEKRIIKIEKDVRLPGINLSAEQRKAFRKIDLSLKKETVALRNELGVKQAELQAELTEEQPDLKKIESLIDDIHKLRASLQKKRIAAELQKRSLLDEQQRKLLDEERPFPGRGLRFFREGGRMRFLGDCPFWSLNTDDDEEEEEIIEIR